MKHQLLAFQLENYDSLRFLKFIYRHPRFWLQGGERQELVWTNKAKGIYILSLLLCFLILGYIIVLSPLQLGMMILAIILVIICSPFFLILSNFLLFPLDLYLKTRTIQKAKAKLQCFPNLQIIGITGSYGKTSTKEVLATILKEKYQVLTTEGNKNTPL
ncbi:MAG: hypothetical protein H6767_01360 [Candidatus Peribacteria bacterium]|nr:MAG: hypothetical protein H6767_01360 [Candidatus Peribacteria bacterium]